MKAVERNRLAPCCDAVSLIPGDGCRHNSAALRRIGRGALPTNGLPEGPVKAVSGSSANFSQSPSSIGPLQQTGRGNRTHGPYGLELNDNCRTCTFRRNGFFCQLSPAELKDFDAIKRVSAYPPDSILFVEQQMPRGVYVLCEGQVKLSLTSKSGKTLILRIARPGDILELADVLSGNLYEVTAETLRPCQIAFVRTADFLRLLAEHPAVYRSVASQLCSHYQEASEQMSMIGLGSSILEKLAKFLLHWAGSGTDVGTETHFTLPLSHEEIAQCIGTTRESITRAFGELQNQRLVEHRGSTLVIRNHAALRQFRSRPVTPQKVVPRVMPVAPARPGPSAELQRPFRRQATSGQRGSCAINKCPWPAEAPLRRFPQRSSCRP